MICVNIQKPVESGICCSRQRVPLSGAVVATLEAVSAACPRAYPEVRCKDKDLESQSNTFVNYWLTMSIFV